MRALRKRPLVDNIPNEKRVTRGSTGRTIYILLLAAFTLGGLNYLFGDFLLLRGDGLVLRNQTVIATTFIARVQTVAVKQGQMVKEGEQLLQLQSIEVLERIADLSFKRADLAAKEADFKILAETVVQLLPLAEHRDAEAQRVIEKFQGMQKEGFVRSAPYADALKAGYEASKDRVNLASQAKVLKEELEALELARTDADSIFQDLKEIYANGLVRAPVGGAVGAIVPFIGNVYRPGEPMLSVYWGEPYVLLYLPRRYLFSMYVGMKLNVSDGQNSESGVLVEILPLTDALPKEFQNTFQPSDRNQLAKIKLAAGSRYPQNQKVYISRSLSSLLGRQ
jgi:multidrug resistance efflux pump